MFGFIKSLFSPSPADRAFKKCAAASRELLHTVLMFHDSHKLVGTDLQPDESSLDTLDTILANDSEPEHTLPAVSVFLGCIITEQLGGTWQRTSDGSYRIIGVGARHSSIDLATDIQARLGPPSRLTPRVIYESISEQCRNA